ncbi:ABC transporter ATP-binding protein [Pseudoduganella namucuonensis]|uniref:ABC-2 type transport system ATP-binding protein n=1 Tax=Pseudoduganella namucuonensis TaxID=1035707 RepID=A0A1I7KVJ7_9BURK|nr:ATP-binding cassette domain-containing protein [Pseudoduganella namucuonensis]SFV01503.1 ABC-2 type transport system ATP-binding protein [Pseudoduganella namucuonensis]
MDTPVIHTEDLCLQYKRKMALDHLTLTIERGGIHAIVGANGAGKSSLFRVLLGFETPSAGSARLLGCASGGLTPDVRGRVGFVNEEHTLPGWMRVDELAAMQRRQYARWDDGRYRDVVHNFNVHADQKIAQLSRGERAGVNLALALAQGPELLILDEPTLGLDVVAKRAFLEALMQTSYDSGATIIYCSHQMEEIERVADNLVILERGQLRHQSEPAAFCARVRLWVAEFPFKAPDTRLLPGVLEARRIDEMTHLMVFDQDEGFDARLKLLGARSVHSMPVSLDRAVNGYLAKGHISTTPRAA